MYAFGRRRSSDGPRFALPKPHASDYPDGMIGGGRMRNGLLLLAGLGLCACSMEIPSFLGREGTGEGFYSVRGQPPPEPVQVPLRHATLERALHGVIIRVDGEAPTQGYYAPALVPLGAGAPDAAGILSFELLAVPPTGPEAVGPARTRHVTAAVFIPTLALKNLRAFRVSGSGTVHTLPLASTTAG
jgi:hypothetical protein